jgi:mannitol/fructose-specific phosphotransferase system IIA component (Ntr-type)
MISNVMQDNHVLLNVSPLDWQESIRLVAQPLLKDKYITENYIEAMINAVKEYGAYIVVGKGVALAHARPEEGVNKLGLSVMTLKKPINFGNQENDPVKLIFCLAAIDDNAHLDIMRSIVRIINENWKVNEIAAQKTLVDFKKTLKKIEEMDHIVA